MASIERDTLKPSGVLRVDVVDLDQRRLYIDARYERKRRNAQTDSYKKPKWVIIEQEQTHRPTWPKRIAEFIYTVAACREEAESENDILDPAAYFSDKLSVLSDPLRIHTLTEVDVFETFQRSLVRFWPGFGYIRESTGVGGDRVHKDAAIFTEEVYDWLSNGIKAGEIGTWFNAVGGLACIDPTLFKQFFSPRGLFSGVKPLAGLRTDGGKISRERRKLVMDIEGRIQLEASTALDQLYHFAGECTNLLKAKALGTQGKLHKEISEVAMRAQHLADFLGLMRIGGYRETTIIRPTPPEHFITPFAAAVVEALAGDKTMSNKEIADKLISAIRRRRLDLTKLPGFIASFRENNDIDLDNLNLEVFRKHPLLLTDGWVVASFLLKEEPDREEVLERISDEIIPELILQLRIRGLQNREWSAEDYRALGLEQAFWNRHNEEVKKTAKYRVLARENVRAGDVVIEFSTQAGPFHKGHEEVVRGLSRMSRHEMEVARMIPKGLPEDAQVWIGIRVNVGNPHKNTEGNPEVPIKKRYPLAAKVMRDVRRGLFFYQRNDLSAPTPQRLKEHRGWFKKSGRKLAVHIRYVGADALKDGVKYDGANSSLNDMPHIINLQIEHLSDFVRLADRIREILRNFAHVGVIVEIPQFSDLHSTEIRRGIRKDSPRGQKIPPPAVLTALHPATIKEVFDIWSDVSWELYKQNL